MEELRLVARDSGAPTCLYCRAEVAAPLRCHRCDATYHPDCRAELGRCATPGCLAAGTRPVARPVFAQGWRETRGGPIQRQLGLLERLEEATWLAPLLDALAIVLSPASCLLYIALLVSRRTDLERLVTEGTSLELFAAMVAVVLGPFVSPVVVFQGLRRLREPDTRRLGLLLLALLTAPGALAEVALPSASLPVWLAVGVLLSGATLLVAVLSEDQERGA